MKITDIYTKIDKRIINVINAAMLISALFVIVDLSYNILTNGHYNPENGLTLQIQLWVCAVFFIDFLVRLFISQHKKHYLAKNFWLLLFSIPYLNLVHYYHIEVSQHVHYLLTLIPVLRAGFGLIVIIHWYNNRNTTSLMFSYLAVLFSLLYFGALLFFIVEKNPVNPLVHTFWDALWWALMDATTVGSNIIAVTPIGKVLSVFLATLGMMMLPIFTVYITDKMQLMQNKKQDS